MKVPLPVDDLEKNRFITWLESAISGIERDIKQREPSNLPSSIRGGTETESEARKVEELDRLVVHLTQLKKWMEEDSRLFGVIDAYAGQRVEELQRKANSLNIRLAAITTVVGALLGWLLSEIGTPSTILHFLHP